MVNVTDSLRAKLSALDVKARRHSALLAATQAEMADIETAIRVLEKHVADTTAGQQLQAAPFENDATPIVEGEGKPQSVVAHFLKSPKSMPEMILEALASDEIGLGMVPQNVVDFIRRNLKPDADPKHIRPGLWRLHERQRIGKTGDRYHLLDRKPNAPNLWVDLAADASGEVPM